MDSERAPVIEPPRLKVDSGVAYPDAALQLHLSQPVTVSLVLEVSETGLVTQATARERQGHGFDEAAIAAARHLLFEPAKRDGRPVASRISFRYVFNPPSPRLVGRVAHLSDDSPVAAATVTVRDSAGATHRFTSAANGSWSAPDLPPGAIHVRVESPGNLPLVADDSLAPGQETRLVLRLAPVPAVSGSEVEITVKGERPPREVAKRTLSHDELAHSAGTQGDALLSMQNLPGIARPPPFTGRLVVRGSAPDDTGVFVEGTDVPLIYHFGGLSSVLPTELVQKIDFYPGNFSARYGRLMGGVVDVTLRPPRVTGYHLLSEVSVLGFRLLAEGPISHGFSFALSAQRSWVDLIAKPLLESSGAEQTTLPRWADYQAEIHKDFTEKSALSVRFFGSDDAFETINRLPGATDPTLGGAFGYHTNFWRSQARFDSELANKTELHLTVAYGKDDITASVGTNLFNASLHPLTSRAELSSWLMRGVRANVGLDVAYTYYDYALQLPAPTRPGMPSGGPGQIPIRSVGSLRRFQPAAYTEFEITPWRGGRVVPGLRADYDSSSERWDLSPRVNLRQDVTNGFPRLTLKAAWGLFSQPATPLDTDSHLGQPGLVSNRAIHYDVGLEQELTRQIDLGFDVFYKDLTHLVVANGGNAGMGAAYGAEWLLRYKADAHFFGWAAYTLSRSERRDVPSEPNTRFQYDQTHVLTLVGNYKLGRHWQLGARFRFTSGDLYTPVGIGAYNATVGAQLGVADFPAYGARLPAFHQLDLRLEKAWLGKHTTSTFFVDVQNTYLAKNQVGVAYNYNYTQSAALNGIPFLPIFGYRLEIQ